MSTSLVWFRQDLRLADNPALRAATERGGTVIPVFIWAPEEEEPWPPGAASRWWLHQSLKRLAGELKALGSPLILRRGPSFETLQCLLRETGAGSVYWNRRYEPAVVARDRGIKQALRNAGVVAESFNGSLLNEPWTVQNKAGKPFQVFTPFWKTCLQSIDPAPVIPRPAGLKGPKSPPSSLRLDELALEPAKDWAGGMRSLWQPGEAGAQANLLRFLAASAPRYPTDRDRPDLPGTSRLSPHLHFGEISPRQIWHECRRAAEARGDSGGEWRRSTYLTELGWREFAHHLLHHFPETPTTPLRAEFQRFPWRLRPDWLKAWQRGRTGYPLVDAGMRELWATGWMHNRVRMVVASFLVKNLLVPWQEGARWFWDTLVDADLAQNTLGWQWTSGCGADAAPYFRIFNPVSQGERFDPTGTYVRRWVPELAHLPDAFIHRPWDAPTNLVRSTGVDYPARIVSHEISREIALEAYQRMRQGAVAPGGT